MTTPRRILFHDNNEDGTVGGSHQVQFDLIRQLSRRVFEPVALYYQENRFADELRRAGVDVHVWDRIREAERARRRRRRSLTTRAAQLFSDIWRRYRFLRRERIDLLHANNSPNDGYDDWLPAAMLAGIPAITYGAGPYRIERSLARRWLTRRWRRVIAVSSYIEDGLVSAGFRPGRVDKIYNGIDAAAFAGSITRERDEVRRALGVSRDTVLVMMVGHVREWKGQHVVLQALGLLDDQVRKRLHVAFAGGVTSEDVTYYDSLQRLICELDLTTSVTFLGQRNDVPDLMNAADIVLHASTLPEPFGLVVLQGMALGKPVVAANSGGPAEIVTPDSGETFDPNRPEELAMLLLRLADDPATRATMGAAGRERVKAFSLSRMARATERVYARVLKLNGRHSTV